MTLEQTIQSYLENANQLMYLTTQGGWIQTESIEYWIVKKEAHKIRIRLAFNETNLDASGCVFDPIECHGYLDLYLDDLQQIKKMVILDYL